ncbi:6-phosphogluconolactonase [Oligoflexia bacterium]|nr:6-phosphogluconolactonase [Oligoflexia bacterium]
MEPILEIVEPRLLPGMVADEVIHSISDAIADRGRCSLVLSGGSSPGAIYRLLSHPPRVSEVEWDKVHIYWGDERWVPAEDNQSNFRMADETFLSHLSFPQPHVHPVDVSAATPQASADAYADTIRELEGVSVGELPAFDVVLLGMGEDGHIASLFPGSEVLGREDGSLCHAVKQPGGEGYRVTLSKNALFSAHHVIFIVRGEQKSSIVQRVLEGDEPPETLPAKFANSATGKVTWMLDSASASKLNRK